MKLELGWKKFWVFFCNNQSINQSIIINLIWRQLTMLTGASQYWSVRPNYNIIHNS